MRLDEWNGKDKEPNDDKKKVQLRIKKKLLVRSDHICIVSGARALDRQEGPDSVDNAQLPPTRACKLVLISVPNPSNQFENQQLSESGSVPYLPQQLRYVCFLYLPDLFYARVVRLLNMHWPANYSVKLAPIPC
jgi:hypothetical protein